MLQQMISKSQVFTAISSISPEQQGKITPNGFEKFARLQTLKFRCFSDSMLLQFPFFCITSVAIIFNLIIICMSFAFKFSSCLAVKKEFKMHYTYKYMKLKKKKSYFSFINKSNYEF